MKNIILDKIMCSDALWGLNRMLINTVYPMVLFNDGFDSHQRHFKIKEKCNLIKVETAKINISNAFLLYYYMTF